MAVAFAAGTEVEQGRLWALGVNRNQSLLGKVMVFLQRPCTSVSELTPEEWIELHEHIRRITVALDVLFSPDQYNFAFLMNEDVQVHLHVLPRYKTPRTWEEWTIPDNSYGSLHVGPTVTLPEASLARLADTIRDNLPPKS